MPSPADLLVPPRRLGSLLRGARRAAGIELGELAARSGPLSEVELDDLEHGRRLLDDHELAHVVALYGVDDTVLVPERSRLVIDLDEGRMVVARDDIAIEPMSDSDAVLARYLALVYHLRGLPMGTPIGIRDLDVGVLASALELDPADVERRLDRLLTEGTTLRTTGESLRRRLLLPLVGVVVAATAIGVLVLVRDDDPAPAGRGEPTGAVDTGEQVEPAGITPSGADLGRPPVDVGTPAVVENGALATGLIPPAVVENPESAGTGE
ncbi:MAG: helix-turn-helix domain-containing protein [Acidimicrobiales bacterium]